MDTAGKKARITMLRDWQFRQTQAEKKLIAHFSPDQQQSIDRLLTPDNWKEDKQIIWMRKQGHRDWQEVRDDLSKSRLPELVTVQGAVLGIHYLRGLMAGSEEEAEELELAVQQEEKKEAAATKKGGKR